jgi:hypothetical protein
MKKALFEIEDNVDRFGKKILSMNHECCNEHLVPSLDMRRKYQKKFYKAIMLYSKSNRKNIGILEQSQANLYYYEIIEINMKTNLHVHNFLLYMTK